MRSNPTLPRMPLLPCLKSGLEQWNGAYLDIIQGPCAANLANVKASSQRLGTRDRVQKSPGSWDVEVLSYYPNSFFH